MDEDLDKLDAAIVDARLAASESLVELRTTQATLLDAVSAYARALVAVRIDSSRRASVDAMSRLSDQQIVHLRERFELLAAESQRRARSRVTNSDFWLPQVSELEPSDVDRHGGALIASVRAESQELPQALMSVFVEVLRPIRDVLDGMGMADIQAEPEVRFRKVLAHVWFTYREAALGCLAKWSDVEDRMALRTGKAEDLRWEAAGAPAEGSPKEETTAAQDTSSEADDADPDEARRPQLMTEATATGASTG